MWIKCRDCNGICANIDILPTQVLFVIAILPNTVKITYAEDNYNYMSTMCAKEFSDSNFNLEVIGKISIFQEIAQNFTNSQKSIIFQV